MTPPVVTSMRRASREGLSLVEVLMAMTVLVVISTLIWTSFSQISQHKQRIERRVDRMHEVRIAMDRMQRELSMAFVSIHVNPSGGPDAPRSVFIGQDRSGGDRIDFCSFSHHRTYRNAHESDQQELSYFITDHPSKDGKILARREAAHIDDDPEEGGTTQILLENVVKLDLQYLDPLSWEWIDQWDSTQGSAQPNRLPAQVRIQLTVRDPKRPTRVMVMTTKTTLALRWALNHAAYNP